MLYSIHPEHARYYKILECIREDGSVNMWGAAPLLYKAAPELTKDKSTTILLEWISNYGELLKQGYFTREDLSVS